MKKQFLIIISLIVFGIYLLPVSAIASTSKSILTTHAVWNGTIATSFTRGTGDLDNPYIISSAEELAYLAYIINTCKLDKDSVLFSKKNYKLENDIYLNNAFDVSDFDNTELNIWNSIGTGYKSIEISNEAEYEKALNVYSRLYYRFDNYYSRIWSADEAITNEQCYVKASFQGNFDGAGHAVYGMLCRDRGQGLFGEIYGGTVDELSVIDAVVINSDKKEAAGILATTIETDKRKQARILNCFIKNGYVNGTTVGGMAAMIGGGSSSLPIVSNCYVDAEVIGSSGAGGFFWDSACYASNCFVSGKVNGNGFAGGFTAWQEVFDTSYTNCVSLCEVLTAQLDSNKSETEIGGFIGSNEYNVKLTNCFWLQTDEVNAGYEESELYGYAINNNGDFVNPNDKYKEANVLSILNQWVFGNKDHCTIWAETGNQIVMTNLVLLETGSDYIVFPINELYYLSHIAQYSDSGQLIRFISSDDPISISNLSKGVYKVLSLDSSYIPQSHSLMFKT